MRLRSHEIFALESGCSLQEKYKMHAVSVQQIQNAGGDIKNDRVISFCYSGSPNTDADD